MKDIDINDFKVTSKIKLSEIPTFIDLDTDKEEIRSNMHDIREKLGDFQDTIYAHDKYAVLVCLQGMDTAGKDSLIREVFKDFNSRGVVVHSFKVPTEKERSHDYLWRHYLALPERGKFAVFNRTHYENVLVTRVHPEYILGEKIPSVTTLKDVDDKFWDKRFEQINNFEKHLVENGTIIFKFYLHLSKNEQRNRLLRRLEKKQKNWKFSPSDIEERKLWGQYREVYQDAINRTSNDISPWFIVPADDKPTARYIVAKTLYDTLIKFTDIKEPELDPEIASQIDSYKDQLRNE